MERKAVRRTYDDFRRFMFLSELNTRYILSHKDISHYLDLDPSYDLYRMSVKELTSIFGLTDKKREKLETLIGKIKFKDDLLKRLELAMRKGVDLLIANDDLYPSALEDLDSTPAILWIYGENPEPALRSSKITIVGTRRASPYGKRAAADISRYAALRDTAVVSGMALGIDGIAHRSAISAGGYTIAVLASGVDVVYPPAHVALYHKILEQGAVLSEHPPGTPATANRFPARNRILAAMSPVTIVAESSMKSGTLITVDYALKYNRDVMVVPGNIYSPESKGCNKLIQTGAMPLIDMRDLDEYLGKKKKTSTDILLPQGENNLQDRILRMLSAQQMTLEEIFFALKIEPGLVARELAELEAAGRIMLDRGRYALTSQV